MSRRLISLLAFLFVRVQICEASWLADVLERQVVHFAAMNEISDAPDCHLPADAAYAKSVELLSDGRQSEAEELIDSALKSYPGNTNIIFAKAVLERSRWGMGTAHLWLRELTWLAGDAYLGQAAELAVALDAHEHVNDNMKALIGLSDRNPDDLYLLWLTAIQCREQESPYLGKQRYELLLGKFRLGPVMVHHTYANILTEDIGLYEEALSHRMKAVSMESTSWSLQGLANTLTNMQDYEWAAAVWARLVRMDPDRSKYWHRYGFTLKELQRYSDAVYALQMAVQLNPEDGFCWAQLGICHDLLCQYEQGFRCHRKAADLGRSTYGRIVECYFFGRGVDQDVGMAERLLGSNEPRADYHAKMLLGIAERAHQRKVQGTAENPVEYMIQQNIYDDLPCEALDPVVTACEAAGRLDLAIETQQRLVEVAQDSSADMLMIDAQRQRLERLKQEAAAKTASGE